MAFSCTDCDRDFATPKALNQHLQHSSAHVAKAKCDKCNRTFKSGKALQLHLRESKAHAINCHDRSFDTTQATEQHADGMDADHAKNDQVSKEQTLQQHHRKTLSNTSDVYDMRPLLHEDVAELLSIYNLTFTFMEEDESVDAIQEYDASIRGVFTCDNTSCSSPGWKTGHVAIWIRMFPGKQYNARVFYQRCKSCKQASRPELDDSYAARISYRLAKWSGVEVARPYFRGGNDKPHKARLCEGCILGHHLHTESL